MFPSAGTLEGKYSANSFLIWCLLDGHSRQIDKVKVQVEEAFTMKFVKVVPWFLFAFLALQVFMVGAPPTTEISAACCRNMNEGVISRWDLLRRQIYWSNTWDCHAEQFCPLHESTFQQGPELKSLMMAVTQVIDKSTLLALEAED